MNVIAGFELSLKPNAIINAIKRKITNDLEKPNILTIHYF
jgi:hypothetical protein